MPYTKILNKVIEKSGLTVKEIAERCTADGVKVTASYISTLKNAENNRTPSDEMSRAIARACNFPDEDILVIEAYVDNAPPEFKGVFDFLRETMITTVVGVFENRLPKETIEQMKQMFSDMSISTFIREIGKKTKEDIEKGVGTMNLTTDTKGDDYTLHAELRQAVGFDVKDNSMFPTMPKDSKAVLEMCEITDYKDGDILGFIENESENFLYRKVAFLNKEHTLFAMFPLSTEYETKTYSVENVKIIGKVKQVITDLK